MNGKNFTAKIYQTTWEDVKVAAEPAAGDSPPHPNLPPPGGKGPTVPGIDANGNLATKSGANGTISSEWDNENRLTRVVYPGTPAQETRYEYCRPCSLGLLAKKTRRDGTTVEWVWDGADVVEESDWTCPGKVDG